MELLEEWPLRCSLQWNRDLFSGIKMMIRSDDNLLPFFHTG